jgi:DNA-binding HxlR family transcriptional regulator
MALGEGPLRTKNLAARVPGYAPRTIYRHAGKLAALGLIEREERPGVPSTVIHRLAEPRGRELYELVGSSVAVCGFLSPDQAIDARAWGSMSRLADLWESGILDRLSCAPCSAAELRLPGQRLSHHQISRRLHLLAASGLLSASRPDGRRKRYALTEQARRAMGLIAGLGRWRQNHVTAGLPGLDGAETAMLLRAGLPLVTIPGQAGKRLRLGVLGGGGEEALSIEVGEDGVIDSCRAAATAEALASGSVAAWLAVILEDERGELRLSGDVQLAESCFARLHKSIWRGTAVH